MIVWPRCCRILYIANPSMRTAPKNSVDGVLVRIVVSFSANLRKPLLFPLITFFILVSIVGDVNDAMICSSVGESVPMSSADN